MSGLSLVEALIDDDFYDREDPRAWVERDGITAEEAVAIVRRDCDPGDVALVATAVLMREESGVEARINGHEFPYFVECTERARAPRLYWRVQRA